MTAAVPKALRSCIYCGQPAKKVRRGEHVIPEAIGGELTINELSDREVCSDCNNGVLSQLDRELCNRSFLSIVASQEIAAHVWQAWDVDHSAGNLLVEARPSWVDGELSSLVAYPQLTIEPSGPELRGDAEEMERFGREDFPKVLTRAVHRAFQRYNCGEKRALHFERVPSAAARSEYRYAPRVYAGRSIFEIARKVRKQSFVVRYTAPEDCRRALLALSRMDGTTRYNRWSHKIGSHYPAIAVFFDLGLVIRSLMKMAVNLLASYCTNTEVTHTSFQRVIRVIRGELHPGPKVLVANGFVHADDVQRIAEPGCHTFRLLRLDGEWVFYACFFGGRIGAVASFPGPSREDWGTMDVVAPVRSKQWRVSRSPLIQPLKVRVEWRDRVKIAPSLKFQKSVSELVVEEVATRNAATT